MLTLLRLLTISIVIVLSMSANPVSGFSMDEQHVRSTVISSSFSFNPYPDRRQDVVNSVLQTISEGSGKLRAFTSYKAELEIVYRPLMEPGKQAGLVFGIERTSISGDTGYRDFDLSHLLIPDKADFVLRLYAESGSLVTETRLEGLDIESEDSDWFMVSLPGENLNGIYAEFSDTELYYDHRTLERIKSWGEALAGYYQATFIIEEAEELIDGLDPDNPETLLLDEFRLCQAEALAGEIAQATFHSWLNLPQADPEQVIPAYERLIERIDVLRTRFNASITLIDQLFYRSGISITEDSPELAREYFLSAITYNPFHIPSHVAIADADLKSGSKVEALARLGDVFSVMNPVGLELRDASYMTDSVLKAFYDDAREYIGEQRFTQSLELLEHATRFCTLSDEFYTCTGELGQLLRASHMGIYDSFLVVSSRALRNDNLRLARIYIDSALDYQQANNDFIPTDGDALDLLFSVFTRHRVLSDLFGMFGNSGGDNEHINAVRDIGQEYELLHTHLLESVSNADLQSAVLNYSVAGMPAVAIKMLVKLQQRGVRASEVTFHQRIAGRLAAAELWEPGAPGSKKPETLLDELNAGDPWLSIYRQSFYEGLENMP